MVAFRLISLLRSLGSRRDVLLGVPALAVLLAALGGFVFYPAWSANHHWRRAERAVADRDFVLASTHFKQYLAVRPQSAEGYFNLARVLRRAGRMTEADSALAQAERLDWVPEQVALERKLRVVQQGMGQARDHEYLAACVRADHPDETIILEALVQGYRAALQFNHAGHWLDYWVERFPDDWLARQWRAEHLQAFGRLDQASGEYRKLLELRPDHDEAHLRLGLIALANRAQAPEAEGHLQKFLDLHPGHPEALLGLARCRRDQGDLAAAADFVEQVLDKRPSDAEAALLFGAIRAEQGQHEAALSWLRKADQGGADPQATQFQLALVLKRLGKPAEAEVHERRFQKLEKAKQALDKAVLALLEEPTSAARHYDVGVRMIEMGQQSKGERYLLGALRLDPAHRPAHEALADYYTSANRLDLAQRHRELAKSR